MGQQTQFFRPTLSYLFEENSSEKSIKEREINSTRKLAVVVPGHVSDSVVVPRHVGDDDPFATDFVAPAVPRRISLNVATVNVGRSPHRRSKRSRRKVQPLGSPLRSQRKIRTKTVQPLGSPLTSVHSYSLPPAFQGPPTKLMPGRSRSNSSSKRPSLVAKADSTSPVASPKRNNWSQTQ